MFDWNDEELTNIIWGEAEEGGDHIVPHPDANNSDILRNHAKNETNNAHVDLKPKELTKSLLQNSSHSIKEEESCSPDGNALNRTRYSLTRLEKVHDLEEVETVAVQTAAEIFQCPVEESEQGDFVDYGWASVGNFEDLDRIFSNDDPIHGNSSLGITEDLWTSCRDGTSNPENSIFLKDDALSLGISPLRKKTEQFDVEACYGTFTAFASSDPQDRNWLNENAENNLSKEKTPLDQSDCIDSITVNTRSVADISESMDKGNLQKKLLKTRKRVNEDSIFLDLEHGCIGHQNRYTQSHSPYSPTLIQPSSSSSFIQPMPRDLSTPYYGHLPSLSPFDSMGVRFNQHHEMPYRSLSMTPQEKIEKLRRRQQMRAMLAIQKQQEQLGSGESSMKHSESEQNRPTFDSSFALNSPMKQDFSNKSGMVGHDESSVVDSTLYQLQDTIEKLDMKVRLSMRDSLLRLATSANQRRYAGGTSSDQFASRTGANEKQDSNIHKRLPESCNVETDTNSIDRNVAHLLFYRRQP